MTFDEWWDEQDTSFQHQNYRDGLREAWETGQRAMQERVIGIKTAYLDKYVLKAVRELEIK